MKKIFCACCLSCALLFSGAGQAVFPEAHASLQSKHSFDLTVERIKRMLKQTAVHVYGIIDYQKLARTYGHAIRPMQAILFTGGLNSVQLLQAEPRAALDLPLRVLIHEDDQGVAWITYHKAGFLIYQHGLTENNVAARQLADELYSLVREAAD